MLSGIHRIGLHLNKCLKINNTFCCFHTLRESTYTIASLLLYNVFGGTKAKIEWYGFRIYTCMINYKNIRDNGNAIWNYATIESEVKYLSRKMNFSVEEILNAIQEVGLNRDEIAQYIEDRRNRM